jgi:hypothetical protein
MGCDFFFTTGMLAIFIYYCVGKIESHTKVSSRHTILMVTSKEGGVRMKKKKEEPHVNISGSFQVIDETRREDLEEIKQRYGLDEESLYYARQFMED